MAGPIKLGVAPIAWSNNDLLELGGDTTLETCLKETRQAGFSGTETGVKFPMDPEVLGPILKKHKLALISGWFSGELLKRSVKAEQERMMAQIDTYKALGAPAYVYAETTGTVQNKIEGAALEAAAAAGGRLPRLWTEAHRARRVDGRVRRADDLSPPHGNGHRDRARDRPPDAAHRRPPSASSSTPATSPSPAATSPPPRGGTDGASTTSTARTCVPT